MSLFRRNVMVVAVVVLAASGLGACNGGSSGGGGKRIALLLPESQTTRYESLDRPLFEAQVKKLCKSCKVVYKNANNDKSVQQSQMEATLSQQVDAVVLDPVDSSSAGSLVQKANQKKVPVVAYDRLIRGGKLDAYMSFDNVRVGRMQAQALVDKLKKDGKKSGKIVMINGDRADNNAQLFNQGAHEILDSSGFTVVPGQDFWTEQWKSDEAQAFMEGQISKLGSDGFVGVYAANDATAGGAIAAMRAKGVKPLPPVTGQDAEKAGVQRIIGGEQFMTVYKKIKPEADDAAKMAVALAQGKKPKTSTTMDNGAGKVPSILLDPVAVTKSNVKKVIFGDNFYTPSQICTGEFAKSCDQLGIH
ncbi:MAG TPA: sugar ABC transporter substrate-binding protein [Mycobacteriales bacterium]